MSIVELKDVYFSYEEGPSVLEGINLSLSRSNISVIMGPSGAGKTTLLRIVNLLEDHSEGEVIHSFGESVTSKDPDLVSLRRQMGFLFQEPALFDASVRGNVAYGLIARSGFFNHFFNRARKLVPFLPEDKCDVEEKVNRALSRVGMEGFQNRSVRSLSAGEHKRVSLARSLVTDPELLLLDEPTGNLDPRNTAIVENIIGEVQSNETTVFLASHDMHQAERIGEEVFLLIDGRIIEGGPAKKIFTSPDDQRTEAFINGKLVCQDCTLA